MAESTDRRELRRRQYLSLGLGELVAAGVFGGVATWYGAYLGWQGRAAVAGAVGPLVLVLVAAGFYWLLARRWVGVAPMPRAIALAYLGLGLLAVLLLAGGLVVTLVAAPSTAWLVLLLLAWGFGVVELVNYSLRRLAFPDTRWWSGVVQGRTPQLARDVRAGLAERP